MNITNDQIRALIYAVRCTREQELTCDECLAEVGGFAEAMLQGRQAAEAAGLTRQHLDVCGECREEFEVLLKALEGLAGPQP